VTFDVGMIERRRFCRGLMRRLLDRGWKAINESDMCLMPDRSPTIDPFFAETTLVITCDVLEPTTGEPTTATRAAWPRRPRAMVKSMGVGDTIFFGPEAEFFVSTTSASRPLPTTPASSWTHRNCRSTRTPNMRAASRPPDRTKAGYFPVPPQDSVQDMRSEMLGRDGQDGRQR